MLERPLRYQNHDRNHLITIGIFCLYFLPEWHHLDHLFYHFIHVLEFINLHFPTTHIIDLTKSTHSPHPTTLLIARLPVKNIYRNYPLQAP